MNFLFALGSFSILAIKFPCMFFSSYESEYDDPADVVEITFDDMGGVRQQRYTESVKVKPSQEQQKDDYSEPIRRRKKKPPPPDYESEVSSFFLNNTCSLVHNYC